MRIANQLIFTFCFVLISLLNSCGKGKLTLQVNAEFDTKTNSAHVSNRPVFVTYDISSGSYKTNPTITVSVEGGDIIDHCIAENAHNTSRCCDLDDDAQVLESRTLTKTIGITEGNYCFSFRGRNIYGFASETVNLLFNVDNGIPDISAESNKRVIQSNEEFDYKITSSEIGSSGLYFNLFNFGQSTITNCMQMDNVQSFNNNALSLDPDSTPDTIHFLDFSGSGITFTYTGKELLYSGKNTLYALLIDTNGSNDEYACPSVTVKVEDFEVFEFTSSGNLSINGSNEYEFIGGFSAYGPSVLGSDGKSDLELNIYNIVN